jgi:hypothetical protein
MLSRSRQFVDDDEVKEAVLYWLCNQPRNFFSVAPRSLQIAGLSVLRRNEVILKSNVLMSVTMIFKKLKCGNLLKYPLIAGCNHINIVYNEPKHVAEMNNKHTLLTYYSDFVYCNGRFSVYMPVI